MIHPEGEPRKECWHPPLSGLIRGSSLETGNGARPEMGPASNRNSQSSSAVQPDDGEAVESRSLASPQGYAAFVEELPGANTQGATLEEARANLVEAVAMVLEANRELAEEELLGQEVIREQLALA